MLTQLAADLTARLSANALFCREADVLRLGAVANVHE